MKKKEKTLIQELILPLRRLKPQGQWQLLLLLLLMILSSISQMVSWGTIFPFLSAVGNPQQLLSNDSPRNRLSLLNRFDNTLLVIKI